MFKKFVSALLCVACIGSAVPVSASEFVSGDVGTAYETSIEVSHREFSHYTVSVPVGLQEGMNGQVELSSVSLEEGFSVGMFITNLNNNGTITLTNDKGREMEATVFVDESSVSNDSVACTFDGDGSHNIRYEKSSFGEVYDAGFYNGIICFKFELIENNGG